MIFMWYKNFAELSFVLSQITCLTDGRTDRQTDGRQLFRG